MAIITDTSIVLHPYTGEKDNPRYREHYGWLHIAGDSAIAEQVDRDSDAFQLALQWYGNFRHLFGRHNAFLDALIDNNPACVIPLDNRSYAKHYREYRCKGVIWFGWWKHE